MEWSIFDLENEHVNVIKENINEIPCLIFKPKKSGENVPTIIYYHGWQSSKEIIKFQAITISTFGYQVIVPDALYHGERGSLDYNDYDVLRKYIWEIIFNSIDDSPSLIESITKNYEADPNRVLVMGDSMGAITAGGIFVKNPNVKCLAGFNGGFTWDELIKKNILPSCDTYKEKIKSLDPLLNIDRINHRAISIYHGVNDTSIPIDIQRKFVRCIQPHYLNKSENLHMIEFSNVDHRVTSSMLGNLISWLSKRL